MALAPTTKVVLGSIAFGIFWVLAVFPAVPFLPIGRTAGSLLGAMLMVIFQVISPDEAYAAIDLPILGLLFGTMVVSIYLERADMFKYLCKLLSWKSNGGKDLLCRICIISAVSSALFTNDTCCVVLTEFVLKIARQNNLPPQPFLLALASSANIGSSATPIGNPQNLIIAVQSKISFGKFLAGILPAMLVGIVVNAAILLCYFWKYLSNEKDEEAVSAVAEVAAEEDVASHRFSPATMSHLTSMDSEELISTVDAIVQSEAKKRDSGHAEALSNRFASGVSDKQSAASGGAESSGVLSASKEAEGAVGISHGSNDGVSMRRIVQNSVNSNQTNSLREGPALQSSDEMEDSTENWKRLLWKSCVYLVTIGMLVSLLLGLNMSWTALTAALALVVLDFKDAHPCLEKVSYSLLIFFCGMFITVDGFDKTGIPSTLWDFMEPHARINSALGVVILALVILVLSNIASNVPTGNKESFVSLDEGVKSKVKHGAGKFQNTEGKGVIAVMTKGVLLLGARVAASAAQISPAEETKAWLILAWVSTVAGNLTLLGSAANLIVCEQAHRVQYFGYNLSFFSHLRFGLPSTLIVTAIGLLLIRN